MSTSRLPLRLRAVALLLLLLQGLVALSPLLEPRNVADLPKVHMEQKDAPHVDLHNEDTCALCSARATFAVPPLPMPPLVERDRVTFVPVTRDVPVVSTDVRPSTQPRAPPVIA